MSASLLFKILVYVGDEHLVKDLTQRIRSHFKDLPHEMDFESSLRKLPATFQIKNYECVILAAGSATRGVSSTLLDLQGLSGSVRLLYLGSTPLEGSFPGVDSIALPIVNWSALLDCITEAVPPSLAMRHGIAPTQSPLRKQVEAYSQSFRKAQDPETSSASPGLLAPFYLLQPTQIETLSKGHPTDIKHRSQTPLQPSSEEIPESPGLTARASLESLRQTPSGIFWELALLGFLAGFVAVTHALYPEDPSEHWITAKNLSRVLMGVGVLGFFFNRLFEQLLFKAKNNGRIQEFSDPPV